MHRTNSTVCLHVCCLCSLQGPSGASWAWTPEAHVSPWGGNKDHHGGACCWVSSCIHCPSGSCVGSNQKKKKFEYNLYIYIVWRIVPRLILASYFIFNARASAGRWIWQRKRPPIEPPHWAKMACIPVTHLLPCQAGLCLSCPVMYCCFNHKRKLLPTHHLLQFYKRNKYLSTKIAHLSDHKWGWALYWSPDVRAERSLCLFSIWAGRSLRKYVLSRRPAAKQNSSTHGVRGIDGA